MNIPHFTVAGHTNYLCFLCVLNNGTVNINIDIFVKIEAYFYSSVHLGIEKLHYREILP